jgi:hypothetical protein
MAGKPVMEGKATSSRSSPTSTSSTSSSTRAHPEVIAAVKAIAPTFGGINLEDIKSPDCFEIEQRLQEECDIPIFHDDQHGTPRDHLGRRAASTPVARVSNRQGARALRRHGRVLRRRCRPRSDLRRLLRQASASDRPAR